jgi:hypothetical protein
MHVNPSITYHFLTSERAALGALHDQDNANKRPCREQGYSGKETKFHLKKASVINGKKTGIGNGRGP